MSRIGPGSVIAGRYQVEAQIGSGGMATVYRCEDIQLGRKLAVKVLHDQYAEDEEFVERFRREAKAAAQLQHPGIVSVWDSGSWDGTWYIAMELLEGLTLKEKIQREGRVEPGEAVAIIQQILRAIRAAHRDGIIHRDIKPHNVILDEEGRPKVTDFGIARRGASDMTVTGSILGTAHYIAPEQAQGEVITPRTDLYAVGVVLYEMLTGRTPFEGDTAVSIALAHVNNEPRSPRSVVPDVSPALDAVVMRALAKRPSDRFADADAFLAALADAQRGIAPVYSPGTGENAVAPYPPPGQGTGPIVVPVQGRAPWWRRPSVIALAALLLVAGLVAAAVLSTRDEVRVPDVVGTSLPTAQSRLANAGFDVAVTRRQSRRAENTVISQAPQGGGTAAEGSTIRLTVSDGAGTATVPRTDGLTLEEAQDRLETAGFRTRVDRQDSEEVDRGDVIETSPPGGTLATLDEVVTVVVSTGPESVEVPNVVGQTIEAARATLDELGLRVQIVEEESASREPGTVLSTSPQGGSAARVGDRVTVTIAGEPQPVAVPDVTGRTERLARRRLEALGFEVSVQTEAVDSADEDGLVQSTAPGAGTEADPGSTVTIVVGDFTAPDAEPTPTPDADEATTP